MATAVVFVHRRPVLGVATVARGWVEDRGRGVGVDWYRLRHWYWWLGLRVWRLLRVWMCLLLLGICTRVWRSVGMLVWP